MIYSLAYRMSGTAADVEDLTQETFILAQEHLSKFRVEPRFIPPDGMVTATADSK